MKETTYYKLIAIYGLITLSFIIGYHWVKSSDQTQTNPNKVASSEIKQAMQKMGPSYNYRLLPDGILQVDRGDGKWLNLRYERTTK